MSEPLPPTGYHARNAGGSWKIRRRIIVFTLLYIAIQLARIVEKGVDSALNQQIALALIALAGTVISSYVFGAVWDDKNKRGET